jgi:hypothetical protein
VKSNDYAIAAATLGDVDDIARLIELNSVNRGGNLSPEFGRAEIENLLRNATVVVARIGLRLAGVMFAAGKDQPFTPSVAAMLRAWPGDAEAYVYGPVCIDAQDRGTGLLQLLFDRLKALYPGREPILFIEKTNEASLRAHLRLGMRVVAQFSHHDREFLVLNFKEHPSAMYL